MHSSNVSCSDSNDVLFTYLSNVQAEFLSSLLHSVSHGWWGRGKSWTTVVRTLMRQMNKAVAMIRSVISRCRFTIMHDSGIWGSGCSYTSWWHDFWTGVIARRHCFNYGANLTHWFEPWKRNVTHVVNEPKRFPQAIGSIISLLHR